MISILLVFTLLLAACTENKKIVIENTPDSPDSSVKTYQAESDGTTRPRQRYYEVVKENCSVRWMVYPTKVNPAVTTLSFRPKHNPECKLSFAQLADSHKQVLTALLKDFPAKEVKNIETHGLRDLDPSSGWSEEIGKASQNSKLWQEYRRDYPKHKSGLSSNAIFKKLVEDNKIASPFTGMFADLGVPLAIGDVEKVMRKGEVMTDVGVIWWRAQRQ